MLHTHDLSLAGKAADRTRRYHTAITFFRSIESAVHEDRVAKDRMPAVLQQAISLLEDALGCAPDHDAWVRTWDRYCFMQSIQSAHNFDELFSAIQRRR